jgi:hypothetical protein
MKQAMAVFLFCMLFFLGNNLRAATLPDGCGDDHARFDVKTEKDAPAPAPPQAGKARIVFIGRIDAPGCLGCSVFSPRIGVDGSWVGATKGDSYFVLDVDPGVHHVCADWKSLSMSAPEEVSGPPTVRTEWALDLKQLSDDKGWERMKNSALATATPR